MGNLLLLLLWAGISIAINADENKYKRQNEERERERKREQEAAERKKQEEAKRQELIAWQKEYEEKKIRCYYPAQIRETEKKIEELKHNIEKNRLSFESANNLVTKWRFGRIINKKNQMLSEEKSNLDYYKKKISNYQAKSNIKKEPTENKAKAMTLLVAKDCLKVLQSKTNSPDPKEQAKNEVKPIMPTPVRPKMLTTQEQIDIIEKVFRTNSSDPKEQAKNGSANKKLTRINRI